MPALSKRSITVGSVEEEPSADPAGKPGQLIYRSRIAKYVRGQDRARAGDPFGRVCRVHVQGLGIDIHKDRGQIVPQNGVDGRIEGVRRHQHSGLGRAVPAHEERGSRLRRRWRRREHIWRPSKPVASASRAVANSAKLDSIRLDQMRSKQGDVLAQWRQGRTRDRNHDRSSAVARPGLISPPRRSARFPVWSRGLAGPGTTTGPTGPSVPARSHSGRVEGKALDFRRTGTGAPSLETSH